MPDISKITLPSGTTYDIKDTVARQTISGTIVLRGETITQLSNGSTTNPIQLIDITTSEPSDWSTNYTDYYTYDSSTGTYSHVTGAVAPTWAADTYYKATTYTAVSRDVVFYKDSEYIYMGTATLSWHDLGNASDHGAMAAADTASGTYTPSGSVSISSLDVGVGSGETTYTPSGSVSAPTISVDSAGATDTVNSATAKTVVTDMSVAAPSSTQATGELVYMSVANETLTFQKFVETTGDSITTTAKTVKTGDASYVASTPAFSGTGVHLETESGSASITGTEATITVYPDPIS